MCVVAFTAISFHSFAQEQRIRDNNSIGWLVYTGGFKLNPRITLHTELQWRRTDGIKQPQQWLARTSVNYALHKDVSINAGYAFAYTYPYGDYPVVSSFPEHRIFEQVVLKSNINKVQLAHRFTLEQRFVGSPVYTGGEKSYDYKFYNRMRYRLRTSVPLFQSKMKQRPLQFIFMDEVFIGWGKNVGANVFDQNRIALLLGYQVSKAVSLEAGYISQILQQGKRINGNPVFQYNNGMSIAAHFSFDLSSKKNK